MGRTAMVAGPDLSPLPAVDDPVASLPVRNRSRWPVLALVGVLAAVGIAFPGRLNFERYLVKSWAGPWAAAEGLDSARLTTMARVAEAGGPDDAGVVNLALAGLYAEEAGGLDQLASRIRAGGRFDPGMRTLADELRAALAAQAADLRAVAQARVRDAASGGGPIPPDRTSRTSALVDLARTRLRGQLRRFQLTNPAPAGARLHAADDALGRLIHWLDQPTGGTILLTNTDSGLMLLDVDASRAVPAGWPEEAGSRLASQPALVAYASGGGILVGPASARGTPHIIAHGDQVIAAGRADAFWVLAEAGVANPTIAEVDAKGGILLPPMVVPNDGSGLYGMAVPGGLVRTTPNGFGLQVWDPMTGRVRVITNQDGDAVAVLGPRLAWNDTNPSGSRLHLTDTSTGADRILVGAGGPIPSHLQQVSPLRDAQGEFSPDGRRLAYYTDVPDPSGRGNNTTKLTVLDLSTGVVSIPAGHVSQQGPGLIAWTLDSQRVFFGINTTSGRPELATYRLGDAGAHTLRFRSPTVGIGAILALAP